MASLAATADRVIGMASRHGGRAALFLLNFGASKGAAFLGPLVLAAVLAPDVYGAVELALSAGLLLALVVGLGVSSAVPLMALRTNPVPTLDLLAATSLVQGLLLGAGALVSLSAGADLVVVLVLLVTCLSAAQGSLGIHLRVASKANSAAWASSLALLAMTAVGAGLAMAGAADLASITGATGAIVLALLCVAGLVLLGTREPQLGRRLRQALSIGLPMVALGFVSVWLASSGRFLTGALLGLEDVAVYAVDFRIAGLLLIVHQVLATAAFAQIFRLKTRRFDRLASAYIAALGAVALALVLLFPHVAPVLPLKALPAGSLDEAVGVFGIVALTVFLWNASAALEMRVNRARLSGRAAVWSGVAAAAFVALAFLLHRAGLLDLEAISWLLAAQMLAVTGIQLGLLAGRKLVLPRVSIAIAASSIVLGLAALMA